METEKPNNFFFRFEDLRIYHKALDYVSWVYVNSANFPEDGANGLRYTFNRAAQNIAIYIAEGSGRNKTQFIYYLKMAKSSIRECIVITTMASRMGFMNEKASEESRFWLIEMTKMVGALIASLQRSVKSNEEAEEEEEPEHIEDFNRFHP